jgi:hypothetical protein
MEVTCVIQQVLDAVPQSKGDCYTWECGGVSNTSGWSFLVGVVVCLVNGYIVLPDGVGGRLC